MEIISGSNIANEIKEKVKEKNQEEGISPLLAIIVVGDDKESLLYVGLKTKAVEASAGETQLILLDKDVSKEDLLKKIDDLNRDETVDGILLQLPLPEHLELYREDFLTAIAPAKDVDGFSTINRGRLMGDNPDFVSCAALACMEVINRYTDSLTGKTAVLIGNSFDVIIPLAIILIKEGCRVSVLPAYDSKSTGEADILLIEKGQPGLLKGEGLKKGAILLDAGFYWHAGRSCGNVDRDALKDSDVYLLPVPGGLGPLLIAKLMENLSLAALRRRDGTSQGDA